MRFVEGSGIRYSLPATTGLPVAGTVDQAAPLPTAADVSAVIPAGWFTEGRTHTNFLMAG
jgi:hypothetical protein